MVGSAAEMVIRVARLKNDANIFVMMLSQITPLVIKSSE
jgi:hypothetical protein